MDREIAPRGEPLEIRASDLERRRVIATLQAACVEGRLSLDEYSQRVEDALAARTRQQLEPLLADLPAQGSGRDCGAMGASVRGGGGPGGLARGGQVSTTVAVLGSSQRSGFWRLAEDSRVLAVLGSCKLDLRSARISASVTTIDVGAVLGSVDVVVPAGVEVELEVHAVLGTRDVRMAGTSPAVGAPVIRITGVVLLGSLNVRDAAEQQAHVDAYG
jgi:hypothetical protein